MGLNFGTAFSITSAIILVIVALLSDLRTAALLAGLYLVGFFLYRMTTKRKKRTDT